MVKNKKGTTQTDRLRLLEQALNGAEASLTVAKRVLLELRRPLGGEGRPAGPPGVEGIFDGQGMVTEKGEKRQVPENYASKSMLVHGDRLKMIEEGGQVKFKQVERVKRQKMAGLLCKKDGKWCAVTSDGSYRVLPAAVSYFTGAEGDEVKLVLPLKDKHVPFAAVEAVVKKAQSGERKVESGEGGKGSGVVKKAGKPEKKEPKKTERSEKETRVGEKKVKKAKKSAEGPAPKEPVLGEEELR